MQMIRVAFGISALLALVVTGIDCGTPTAAADSLYVGDAGNASVKVFDATTGAFQGVLVKKSAGGLHTPRGLIFDSDDLLVVDQNANRSIPSDILLYSGVTGKLLERVVPHGDPNAPSVARGMILWNDHLFVGDLTGEFLPNRPLTPGRVRKYTKDGDFVADLTPGPGVSYHPTGVVLGPDGLLYVSNVPGFPTSSLPGQVLRFNPGTGAFVDTFINSTGVTAGGAACGCVNDLHRPEGLVFGPDGNLYITSPFQQSSADTDKILVFDGTTGTYLREIVLYPVGEPRAHALALIFGPGSKLFVPIAETGEVRRYDVGSPFAFPFDVFVTGGGGLVSPFYLTFGDTDPATLAYP